MALQDAVEAFLVQLIRVIEDIHPGSDAIENGTLAGDMGANQLAPLMGRLDNRSQLIPGH